MTCRDVLGRAEACLGRARTCWAFSVSDLAFMCIVLMHQGSLSVITVILQHVITQSSLIIDQKAKLSLNKTNHQRKTHHDHKNIPSNDFEGVLETVQNINMRVTLAELL